MLLIRHVFNENPFTLFNYKSMLWLCCINLVSLSLWAPLCSLTERILLVFFNSNFLKFVRFARFLAIFDKGTEVVQHHGKGLWFYAGLSSIKTQSQPKLSSEKPTLAFILQQNGLKNFSNLTLTSCQRNQTLFNGTISLWWYGVPESFVSSVEREATQYSTLSNCLSREVRITEQIR